jgi:hypothetical protein
MKMTKNRKNKNDIKILYLVLYSIQMNTFDLQTESVNQILDVREETCNIPETQQHNLLGKWNLYYHLPHDKNWDLSSYKIIMNNIDSLEKLIAINENVSEQIVKYCMLFVMRDGITPMWEDPSNRNGGCFSFKVLNKQVYSVWKSLFYAMCGETLFKNKAYHNLVNGITISPKKNFCIIKVWLLNCSVQDPELMISIPNLTIQGCLFKKHEPEF